MDLSALPDLLACQHGVVSRRQLLQHGFAKHDLDRMVRRRELRRLHPGVYVDHTGPPTSAQLRWSAVLYAAPAALHLGSALDADDPATVVHVAIDTSRAVASRPGVRVHRVKDLAAMVRWSASPPRVRVEEAALELASRAATETDAVAALADVVNRRLTTPDRLAAALERRPRTRRRRLLTRVLGDLATGACSVLEQAYLVRVEHAHGLPAAARQEVRTGRRGREYRDVAYPAYRSIVELDGRIGHDGWAAGERDAERDLADAAEGWLVVRLRYRQVLERPCETAAALARALTSRGWTGRLRRCGPGCRV